MTGVLQPMTSDSWKASRPTTVVLTWPVMAIIGTESMNAVANPVIMFSAPGPDVAITTPGFPLARA